MCQYPVFFLRCVILTSVFTVIFSHDAPLFSNSSALISINSSSQFTLFLNEEFHVFVKFFNPSCSHCRAMAPAYVNLSRILYDYNHNDTTLKNRTVACVEVDISKSANRPLLDQYEISGVPTLLLFHGNSTYDEHAGARTTDAMFKFIQRSLELFEQPRTPHLISEREVLNFLKLVDQRPITLSVLHSEFDKRQFYLEEVNLPYREWFELTSSISTNPRPMFATVADPSLLVPATETCRKRYNNQSKRFSFPPIAVAAPSAETFCKESFWYYPGLRDSESLSSFLLTSLVPTGSYVRLTSENSRHLINADRPLILVFGKDVRPDYSALYTLSALSSMHTIRPVVPIYVRRGSFPDLVDYLNLSVGVDDNRKVSEQDNTVVLYYYGNTGPIIRSFNSGGEKSLSEWVATETLILNEATVQTTAGSVFVLNETSWSGLFDFDARSVLLLLTRDEREAHVHFLEAIAQSLQEYSGKLVVSRYDSNGTGEKLTKNSFSSLPASGPGLSEVSERPVLVLVSPGEDVRRYDGPWTVRAVVRFAQHWSGAVGDTTGVVEDKDIAVAFCFVLGVILVIFGLMTSERQWPAVIGGYWQRIKGRGESGNKRQ